MTPSRRQFLALATAASAVLLVPADAEAHPPAVAAFDDDDTRILEAMLRCILGTEGPNTDAVAALGDTLGYLAPDKQALVAQLPFLIDQASRVLVPTLVAWSSLSIDAQRAALDDWATSPIGVRRQIHNNLRQLLLFHAYTDPAAWEQVGYPGPWLGRIDLPVNPLRFGEVT